MLSIDQIEGQHLAGNLMGDPNRRDLSRKTLVLGMFKGD